MIRWLRKRIGRSAQKQKCGTCMHKGCGTCTHRGCETHETRYLNHIYEEIRHSIPDVVRCSDLTKKNNDFIQDECSYPTDTTSASCDCNPYLVVSLEELLTYEMPIPTSCKSSSRTRRRRNGTESGQLLVNSVCETNELMLDTANLRTDDEVNSVKTPQVYQLASLDMSYVNDVARMIPENESGLRKNEQDRNDINTPRESLEPSSNILLNSSSDRVSTETIAELRCSEFDERSSTFLKPRNLETKKPKDDLQMPRRMQYITPTRTKGARNRVLNDLIRLNNDQQMFISF